MAVLLDTNVILRVFRPEDPRSAVVERALNTLWRRGEVLYIASQNIYEFWAVCTRPAGENGLGLTAIQASAELGALKNLFNVLPELALLDEWEKLVIRYSVSGKNTHDARLVAAMKVHGIDSTLTFNIQDFSRYGEISVLDPLAVSRS